MKVSEYHKQGLKNFVEKKPEGYEVLGSAKEGVHRVEFFIKTEDGVITDVKFSSSKRCKKLTALADVVAEKLRGQKTGSLHINPEEVLQFFGEEKEKDKMKNRLSIVLRALDLQ
ncbi:nicotinate phosphoribosyltransferase [Persephonella sp.]